MLILSLRVRVRYICVHAVVMLEASLHALCVSCSYLTFFPLVLLLLQESLITGRVLQAHSLGVSLLSTPTTVPNTAPRHSAPLLRGVKKYGSFYGSRNHCNQRSSDCFPSQRGTGEAEERRAADNLHTPLMLPE